MMRLWSLHPQYLDRQGLVACWREALLAQAVLAGRTSGYRRHPQLHRFATCPEPLAAIGSYLGRLADEADGRGYRFDRTRIDRGGAAAVTLPVTTGQLRHERAHLLGKLRLRSPDWVDPLSQADPPSPHPSFTVVPGGIEPWERP